MVCKICEFLQFSLKYFYLGTETNADIADDAALYVLQLFLDVPKVMLCHMAELRVIFDPITMTTVQKLFAIVGAIRDVLSDDIREFIKPAAVSVNKIEWGDNITCVLPNDQPADVAQLQVSKHLLLF